MQKLTKVEEKLQVLKAIINGEIDLNILRAPQQYYILQNTDGSYVIPGKDVLHSEEKLQRFLKTIRECDSVKILRPQPAQVLDVEQLTYNAPVIDVDYIEVSSTPAVMQIEDKPGRKQKRVKTPVNDPQEVLTPCMIHAGKLSEYGETWGSICED
jgi:hypothetical protein